MPREEENKQVQVKIYLLKERCSDPEDAIRDIDEQNNPPDLIKRPLVSPLRGLLITKRSYSKKPAWASFLEEGVKDSLEELLSASAAALLVLKANNRCFALTNGYAKSILDPSMIERRFGLKVALNVIDPNQLRSVDSRRFGFMAKNCVAGTTSTRRSTRKAKKPTRKVASSTQRFSPWEPRANLCIQNLPTKSRRSTRRLFSFIENFECTEYNSYACTHSE